MVTGKLRGLISTDTLELGIDIGSLDTVVVTEFPSSKASFWQESGRAGRKKEESNIVLTLDNKPLDQYIAIKSEWLFAGDVENAIVNRNNLYIQIAHIRAAAAEIPLSLDGYFIISTTGRSNSFYYTKLNPFKKVFGSILRVIIDLMGKRLKIKNFMVQCNVAHAYTKITEFKEREPIFV